MISKKEKVISLIGNTVFSIPLSEDFPRSFSAAEGEMLLHVAKIHDLAHIVASALKKNGISVPAETETKFQKNLFMAVFRCEKLQYELKRISTVLEEAELPFIPLKGSVLRPFYPESWMRTSCDIDLFVSSENLEKAEKVIVESLGYTFHGQWNGEHSFFSPDGIHLELHYYDEQDEEEGAIFREIWDYVSPAEGSRFCMQTEWEYFYAHHVMHMSKHFAHGGCGIRPFIDLELMAREIPMNPDKKHEYLEKFGLVAFAEASEQLSRVWFADEEHTPLTAQMQEYLLGAGVYGSVENKVALEKSGKSRQLKGFFSHVWLPYDVIKHQYPVLISHKWLTPLYQLRRWFALIFCGGLKRSLEHLHTNRNISEEKVEKVAELMDRLELS